METLRVVLALLWLSGLLAASADARTISQTRVRFTTGDSLNPPAIESNNIQALRVDRAGSRWIGTHAGGLTPYQEGRFTHISTRDGLPDDRVRCLYEDPRGGMWVGTEAGVAVFRDGQVTVYHATAGTAVRISLSTNAQATP